MDEKIGVDEMLMTVGEFREVAKISAAQAYEMVARGEIPSLRIGRAIRLRVGDVKAFLRGGDREAAPAIRAVPEVEVARAEVVQKEA